ncbi:UDP-2,4-diacetamido-2,4,6-trideoxy-beta-L-altropyranose hydrolase [Halopiger xanaduensis]|uniref:Pseudaminic acid biosynthesis-associated protein PseG n=1 Tax=Halopiger xanaduensis (strain DSM 18323 / JCM 14033 / SH-6) TaxID=797210 RepID=F8DAP4_HALXS|nr:UDP-2,4-diacetamido-2,4,6-trideoxy-beta-L-altropyranose hydrolase [Halopiger xanaduensis]AEH36986.1 pseudaminic acid biosynthesis-associated protein PseG [Halopiger xanaduensis SH-6]
MKAVIRADGGPEIGYGHLVRTGAVAELLVENGHRVTYATATPDCVTEVCPSGIETLELPSRTDVSPLLERLEDVNVVLVDSYLADCDYQRALRKIAPTAVVTDDTRHPVHADLVANGNLYAPDLEYEVCGEEPMWCFGPAYLLLRQEIARRAKREPPRREQPERALVTMGGSDTAELTPTVLRAFDGVDLTVDAVVGPGFSAAQERAIREVAADVSARVRVVRDPEDLAERMFCADLAVSTASTTTYELLALGTPIVSIPVVDNQLPIAAALRERDAAIVLERDAGESAIRRAIDRYLMCASLRAERRRCGRELVDGRGARRVYTELLSLVDGDSKP